MTSTNIGDEQGPEIVVSSFGYRDEDQAPPPAHVVLDVRGLVQVPLSTQMRALTGLDPAVREHVLGARGATDLIDGLETLALAIDQLIGPDEPVTVAIGSASGRYRAPALARELGRRLDQAGYGAMVLHQHLSPKGSLVDDRDALLAAVMDGARAAAGPAGTFATIDLAPVLPQIGRSWPWMVSALRTLVDQGLLTRVTGSRPRAYRVVKALHRIVWVNTVYGAGTDLAAVQEAADLMFRTHNWLGDQFDTEWQRRNGSWSLVAIEGDKNGEAWHSGLRVETVNVDQPGALAAGQADPEHRPYIVTQHFDGGGTNEYHVKGQVAAEAMVEASARSGLQATALLDFVAAEKN